MTTTYALLLRGINVGGHRKASMPELRTLLTELGHSGVTTYLQSGNAVLTAASDDENEVAAGIERAVEEHYGFAVDCLVRPASYLRAVADACPFPAAELEGKQLHVTFYDRPVTEDRFAPVDPAAYLPEEFRLGDRALYLYAPDGLGRSALAVALAKPAVTKGLVATSRNWNTVVKLVELTRD
ncbi:DUF1697 domain-containing protein [Streptomyces sp. NPDC002690]